MQGISNKTIVKLTSDDVIGVFPSNFVTSFISFHSMLIDSGAQYPFILMNTDRSDEKDTRW